MGVQGLNNQWAREQRNRGSAAETEMQKRKSRRTSEAGYGVKRESDVRYMREIKRSPAPEVTEADFEEDAGGGGVMVGMGSERPNATL